MVEILVCAVSQINETDIYMNCALPKQGDVIYAAEDGHAWSPTELADPNWRIIQAPALAAADVAYLLAGEVPTDPAHPGNTLQYRGFFLDATKATMPATMSAYMMDATRATPTIALAPGIAVADLVTQRPPVADPALVGNSTPSTIG